VEKITIYGIMLDGGDGSAYLRWYLTEDETHQVEEAQDEGFAEYCGLDAETYIGSNIHQKAVENSKELNEQS